MYNVKIFPSFQSAAGATERDQRFLRRLIAAKADSKAKYVNFSAYRFKSDEAEAVHFITYPLDWVTHYIRSNYIEIDPLFHIDFRRISALDWTEIRHTDETGKFFEDFQERGLGDHGMVITDYLQSGIYAVANFCFGCSDEQWAKVRGHRLETLRLLTHSLGDAYEHIYNENAGSQFKITKRERECLYWVAAGKTDEEIGQLLSVGKWTVVSHLKSAKYKLGAANRASAVAKAMSSGIIKFEIDDS